MSHPPPAPSRVTLIAAALLGALAVLCGAFAAHALGARLDERALAWWRTGAAYHAQHALALFAVGLLPTRRRRARQLAAAAFGIGIALFAGSLYAMALTGVTALGAVTPLGGIALVIGWLATGWASVGVVGSRTDR